MMEPVEFECSLAGRKVTVEEVMIRVPSVNERTGHIAGAGPIVPKKTCSGAPACGAPLGSHHCEYRGDRADGCA